MIEFLGNAVPLALAAVWLWRFSERIHRRDVADAERAFIIALIFVVLTAL